MSQVLVEKEQLTDQKMKVLFGAKYKNMVYFNFDAGAWNRNTYLGFSMGNQQIDTRNAIAMRHALEFDKRMDNFEVVATVTMAVPDESYPGTHQFGANMNYKRSRNIAGTVVLRDKTTGKIIDSGKSWFGVENYEKMSAAAFYGADGFAYLIAKNADVRDKFISGVMLDYQR